MTDTTPEGARGNGRPSPSVGIVRPAGAPPIPHIRGLSGKAAAEFENYRTRTGSHPGLETAELENAFKQDAWIWACIKRITDAMENARIPVFESEDDEADEVTDGPLVDLVQMPNPFDIWTDMLTTLGQGLSLEGECFLVLTDRQGIPVDRIGPRPGPDQKIKVPECIWPVIGGDSVTEETDTASGFLTGWRFGGRGRIVPAHAVVLVKYADPDNRYRGVGPVEAAFGTANELYLATRFQSSIMRKNGDPGGWIETKEILGRDEQRRFEQEVTAYWNNPSRAGETRFLNGASYHPNPLNTKDLQYSELRKDARGVISAVFGVPTAVLGDQAENYATFKGHLRVFWTITILPILLKLQRALNWRMVRRLDDPALVKQRYRLDVSNVEALQGELSEQVAVAAGLVNLGVPINVALKEAGIEIDPIDGGDVALIEAGRVTLVSVAGNAVDDESERGAIPSEALTGVQITALVAIVVAVLEGKLPKAVAVQLIVAAFPFDQARAEKILADAEEGSQEPPPPPPAFGAPPGGPPAPDEGDPPEGDPVEEAIQTALGRVAAMRGPERLPDALDQNPEAPDGQRPIRLAEPMCQKCMGIDRPGRRAILRAVIAQTRAARPLEALIKVGRKAAGGDSAAWASHWGFYNVNWADMPIVAEILADMPPAQLDWLEGELRGVASGESTFRAALHTFASAWDPKGWSLRGPTGIWREMAEDVAEPASDVAGTATYATREQREAALRTINEPLTTQEVALTRKVRRVFNDMRQAQLRHLEQMAQEAADGKALQIVSYSAPKLSTASWATLLTAYDKDEAAGHERPGPRVKRWMDRRPRASKAGLARLLSIAYCHKASLPPEELEKLIGLNNLAFEEALAKFLESAENKAWLLGEKQIASELAGTGFIQATDPGIIKAIETKAILVSEGATSTVANGVREALARVLAEGGVSVTTAQQAILEYFSEFKDATRKTFTSARAHARTIARTELGQVHAKARADSINLAGEQGVVTTKTWLASVPRDAAPPYEEGGLVRRQHWLQDGKETAIGVAWVMDDGSVLDHVRAWGGPAHQVINCKCQEVANIPPVPEEGGP